MTQAKPTPGPWVYVSSDGSIINPNGINDNKDSWHIAELTSKDGCLAANGYLIAEAGTVYHETQLTPRQLLGALQEAKSTMEEEHISYGKPGAWEPESYKIICRALSKTSKEGV